MVKRLHLDCAKPTAWTSSQCFRSDNQKDIVPTLSQPIVVREQTAYAVAMGANQFVVQIQEWDWPLHVGVKPRAVSHDGRPDRDLVCSETVAIDGLILSPEEHRSKLIQLRLYPLARETIFDGREEREVGRLHRDPVERDGLGFYASLFLPADTLQKVLFCLSSKWQRVYLWVDDGAEPNAVTDFAFSGDIEL